MKNQKKKKREEKTVGLKIKILQLFFSETCTFEVHPKCRDMAIFGQYNGFLAINFLEYHKSGMMYFKYIFTCLMQIEMENYLKEWNNFPCSSPISILIINFLKL